MTKYHMKHWYSMTLYYREEHRGVSDSGDCLGSCPDFNDDDNIVSIQQWTNSIFENNFWHSWFQFHDYVDSLLSNYLSKEVFKNNFE